MNKKALIYFLTMAVFCWVFFFVAVVLFVDRPEWKAAVNCAVFLVIGADNTANYIIEKNRKNE